MKKIIQISVFVLFAIALIGLMGFIYLERSNQTLHEINIKICRDTDKGFINENEIYAVIESIDSIYTKKIKLIKTNELEQKIRQNPYVEEVDIFVNISNDLIINVKEKRVVLRIFNQNSIGYYVDENAGILPLSSNYTPRVLIANGYLNSPFVKPFKNINDSVYRSSHLKDLFALTNLINQNQFLKAQISQIYINSKDEFDMIPQLGNQLIQFGKMDDAVDKLNKLEVFYKKALVKAGWEKYETINLQYQGQVVCTQR